MCMCSKYNKCICFDFFTGLLTMGFFQFNIKTMGKLMHCTDCAAYLNHDYNTDQLGEHNPNSIRSYKIVQKLSPEHAARGIVQSPYPTYRHGKACLSKQPPWRAAGDPRLARGRSRVRARRACCARFFFSTLPSFLLQEIFFFAPSPPNLWNLWLG